MFSQIGKSLKFALISTCIFSMAFVGGGCSVLKTAPNAVANSGHSDSVSSESTGAVPMASTAKCEDMIGKMKNSDIPGGKGDLPDNFPPPPNGSTLCGQAGLGKGVFYLNTTMADDDILKYYHEALRAEGYQVENIRTGISPGDLAFDFSRPNEVSGYVSTNGDKDSMGRRFKDFYSIGYNKIVK